VRAVSSSISSMRKGQYECERDSSMRKHKQQQECERVAESTVISPMGHNTYIPYSQDLIHVREGGVCERTV
jgi:hypothetical protein